MMKRFTVLLAMLLLAGCVTTEQRRFPGPAPGGERQTEGQPQPAQPPPSPESQGTSQPPAGTGAPPTTQTPTSRSPQKLPPRTAAEASSPAVRSLLGRADTLANNGNMSMASATLERALDLEPRNPFIYQRLAAVKLAQGQSAQAEAMARKSNSVAGNNPFLRTGNWRLIAEARRASGDTRGASKASSRAADYHRTSLQMQQ